MEAKVFVVVFWSNCLKLEMSRHMHTARKACDSDIGETLLFMIHDRNVLG